MTEQEWLTSRSPTDLLNQVRDAADPRKLRLFAYHVGRRVEAYDRGSAPPQCTDALRAAGLYADGQTSWRELLTLRGVARGALADRLAADRDDERAGMWGRLLEMYCFIEGNEPPLPRLGMMRSLLESARVISWEGAEAIRTLWLNRKPGRDRYRPSGDAIAQAELAWQAKLLRELFGNPFRPCRFDPTWLSHNHGFAGTLARDIAGTERYADLPVLADALEDAGCDQPEVLNHCRTPGVHHRGCWALDGILGRG